MEERVVLPPILNKDDIHKYYPKEWIEAQNDYRDTTRDMSVSDAVKYIIAMTGEE